MLCTRLHWRHRVRFTWKNDLRSSLQVLIDWSKQMDMLVNFQKSGIMNIKKDKNKSDYFSPLLEFPVVDSYKYLGIPWDKSFTLRALNNSLKLKSQEFCQNIQKFCPKFFPISPPIQLLKTFLKLVFDSKSYLSTCSKTNTNSLKASFSNTEESTWIACLGESQ